MCTYWVKPVQSIVVFELSVSPSVVSQCVSLFLAHATLARPVTPAFLVMRRTTDVADLNATFRCGITSNGSDFIVCQPFFSVMLSAFNTLFTITYPVAATVIVATLAPCTLAFIASFTNIPKF